MLQTSKMSSIPTRIPQQHNQHSIGRPAYANGQPSKLQMMQLQMQQRHLKEKEEKLMQYRNQNQNNSYYTADNFNPDQAWDNPEESSTVRKFFQERRELSDQNGYVPNIDQHFKRVKQGTYNYQAQGHPQQGQVRSYGGIHKQREMSKRPPLPVKSSAGRDRAYPLAPIEKTPKQTPHGSRQSSRRSSAQSSNSRGNSFGPRSRFPRPQRADIGPYGSDGENYQSNTEENGMSSSRSNSPKKKSTSFREWQEKQRRNRQASAGEANGDLNGVHNVDNGQLSDFEKWQLEQDANKQARLQKFREQNKNQNNYQANGFNQVAPSPGRSKVSRTFSPETMKEEKSKQKKKVLNSRINSRKNVFPSPGRDSDEDESGGDEDDEIARKQRELEEMINRQQEELARIQREREAEEDRERKEREKRQKRAAEQRERQRKQREAEEKERQEAEERDRKQRELEQQMEDERLARMRARERQPSPKMSSRYEYVESDPEQDVYSQHRTPDPPFPKKAARPTRSQKQAKPPPARHQPPPARQQPPPSPPVQRYQPEPDTRDSGTNFYLQAAAEAESARVDLAPCKVCGRKFARDRLDKHIKVCKDTGKKKRKVFDPVKMRTDGTEMAQYARNAKRRPSPKPKKSNWREQHNNFIKAIRYAKAVTDAENSGGSMANLPPPPVMENSDYKQCPYCERKFNPATAERHIPRCKDIKSRPAPPRARRK